MAETSDDEISRNFRRSFEGLICVPLKLLKMAPRFFIVLVPVEEFSTSFDSFSL